MIDRMIRAAKLQVGLYEEVEADKTATKQAVFVVVIVALASGVGSLSVAGVGGIFAGVVVGLLGWALWAWITYFIGTSILRTAETHADWGQLARTLGYAQSPGVLKVFGVVPGIGPFIFLAVSTWQFVAMIIAIRQALDFTSTWRAVGVAALGFIPYALLLTIIFRFL